MSRKTRREKKEANLERAAADRAAARGLPGSEGPHPAQAGPATPSARLLGYARVSTAGQNLDRQLDALREFGVPVGHIFADRASGKNFERPEWCRLLAQLRCGDTLAIPSIDRLGRSYSEVLDVWRNLTKERGVALVVLDMPLLDTRSRERGGLTGEFISDIVLQLLSYVAEVERDNIRKRQQEGIRAARARGTHLGRPRKRRPQAYEQARNDYLAGSITRAKAAARCKCGVTTFDKWLREDGGGREKTAEGPERARGKKPPQEA